MSIALWILQIVLALVFAAAGAMKASQPVDKLKANMPWVTDYDPNTVRLIGIAELLGAIGLVLPAATGILVFLTPLAAAGLAIIMVLAIRHHLQRSESREAMINGVLLILSLIIVWGRFGPYAF